ncbi:MAG: nicotinate-nucleotide adenylyltransferase [Candidatus Nanopelagicales bacterium]
MWIAKAPTHTDHVHYRLGILGGTFDPIHAAHLEIARAAFNEFSLDRIYFVPAGMPYHRDTVVTDAEHRVNLVDLAIQGDDRLELSRVDVDRAGPTYSIDTVRELKTDFARMHPDDSAEWFFIVGADAYQSMASWRDPQALVREARVIVISRPNTAHVSHKEFPCDYLEVDGWDLSSTQVRDKLASDIPLSAVLPLAVEQYIRDNGLYGLTVNVNKEGT